jgi:indole-3-glycerol phosphate synthase
VSGRFRDALAGEGLAAIAEVKRRSPSAGDLRPDADPAALAAGFERAGAAAVSILVDERFAGSPADLAAARSASRLPLLAKGFFSERSELEELRSLGADAVLLLVRDLDDAQLRALLGAAEELELDALVEAHDAEELRRAVELGAAVIGVNARDLSTFECSSTSSSPRRTTASSSPRARSARGRTRRRPSSRAPMRCWSARR